MALVVKDLAANVGDVRDPLKSEDPLEGGVATHSVFLPGESHGQRNLRAAVHGVAKSQTELKWLP